MSTVAVETTEQLYQAIEQMGWMQRILESYRGEVLQKSPRNVVMLAEEALEQRRQLQAQIDACVRRLDGAEEATGALASS